MSWFSSIVDTVSDFADDAVSFFGGGDVVSSLAGMASDIGGAYISSEANKEAAQTVQQGYQAQADAIREGNQLAQDRYQGMIDLSQPGTDYLRRVVAMDPSQLTPGQTTMREDNLREARNSLAASGLRGAGRAGAAAIMDADRRFSDSAFESNLSRADRAAQYLSGRNFDSGTRAADLDATTGARVSSTMGQGAEVSGQADIANAALKGAALGSLGSFIAQEGKDRAREDRYKDWKRPEV